MKILYKDSEDHTLCVMEITSTTYYQDEQILEFTGDSDVGVKVDPEEAEKIVKLLFDTDKADLTSYPTCTVDLEFDEDDDEDLDLDDFLDEIIDNEDEEIFQIPHRFTFTDK